MSNIMPIREEIDLTQETLDRAAQRSGEQDAYRVFILSREMGFLPNTVATTLLVQAVDGLADANTYGKSNQSYLRGLSNGVKRFLPKIHEVSNVADAHIGRAHVRKARGLVS